jgi:hypothetical protein
MSIAQISIKGRITNELNEVIPYATINIVGSNCGTLSDENGYFELTCPNNSSNDGVIFIRHLGYESKKFRVDEFENQINVILMTDELLLGEVVVIASKKRNKKDKKFEYNTNRPEFYYQKDIASTYQLASYIENDNNDSGYLKDIIFYVGKAASDKVPIRLNFFNIDTDCNCPSKELNTKSIIVNIKKGRNKVNLEEYKIYLNGNDFYVAFEWLSVATKTKQKFDFSIGMIYYESNYPMLEKLGGLNWKKLQRGSQSRIWTKITMVKEQ